MEAVSRDEETPEVGVHVLVPGDPEGDQVPDEGTLRLEAMSQDRETQESVLSMAEDKSARNWDSETAWYPCTTTGCLS